MGKITLRDFLETELPLSHPVLKEYFSMVDKIAELEVLIARRREISTDQINRIAELEEKLTAEQQSWQIAQAEIAELKKDLELYSKGYEVRIAELKAEKLELQEFAIWMTGCGYDFAALPYFCTQRDKLLLEKSDEE